MVMDQFIRKERSITNPVLFFVILTLLFILLNLATLNWAPLPWLDEVWFVDTSVNGALNGAWTTTAHVSYGGETPIALYPPLYQWLLTFWIWVCGFSLFTVRSFNILVAAGCSIVIFKGMREMGYFKKWITVIFFVFLFWGTGLFSWSYRNGRPDMTNLLSSLFFIYSYLIYIKKGNNKWRLLLASILVLLSGLQACPFIVAFLIYTYFTKKEYRDKTKIAFVFTILGFTIGVCLLWGHFLYHDHPKSFFWQFSQSVTISNVLYKFPVLSEYISRIKEIPGHNRFHEFLDCYLKNKNYAILTIINVAVLSVLLFKSKIKYHSIETVFFGFSILMPAIMFLAGHCLPPYTWMFYLPAVLCCIICMERHNSIILKGIYGGLAILFTVVFGLPKTLIESDKSAHDRSVQFVEKQNLKKDVVMLSSYSAYYPIRELTKNSYYPAYPVQYYPSDIEYVLIDKTDSYKYENLDLYMHHIFEQGYIVTPVDSLKNPEIILYLISK
jgi:hypothetical protein